MAKKLDNILFNPFNTEWGEKVTFPSTRAVQEYGNRIYNRYPARSVFLVPRATLSNMPKGLKVLDPFMGSGTTAVESVIAGDIPWGTEMDPFARLVAQVSTSVFSLKQLEQLNCLFQNILNNWNTYTANEIPDLRGIERWFGNNDLDDLLKLKACILDLSTEEYLPFMLVVFADCIKPVSKMERQSTKPYISSKFIKVTKSVEDSFIYSFNSHYGAISEMSKYTNYEPTPKIKWLGNDATCFKCEPHTIDIAITSPPYINAFDYTQCIKVESALCGLLNNNDISTLKKIQVGQSSRRNQEIEKAVSATFLKYYTKLIEVDPISADTCLAFFNDMYHNLKCVYTALKPGGDYHIIIGDSIIKKIDIPSHEIIASLAQHIGYKWYGYYYYDIKDHRTSIPRDNDTSKIKVEHVIMLRK